jgi:hypothetical protein
MKRQMRRTWMKLNGAAMLVVVMVWSAAGQQTFNDLAPQSMRCKSESVVANHSGQTEKTGAQNGKAQVNFLGAGPSRCEMFTAERLPETSGKSDRFSAAEFFGFDAAAKSDHFEFAKETTTNSKLAQAQGQGHDPAELAKKLANPVASLISVPMQSNFDFGLATGSGWRYTLNVQPVIPIKLSEDWNLISRTIVPIIHQGNVTGPETSQSGLGDITQSLFFSPNKSEPFIWAVGPVFLIPTATDAALGTQKWGVGPTALALKQAHGWTYGMLANHIWSVAGKSNRSEVNSTFLQPFLTYNTKDAWTYSINTEATYDWVSNSWSVPINPLVSKLVRFGKQPVSFGGGVKCWAVSPAGGPDNCSIRIVVTALFPKG